MGFWDTFKQISTGKPLTIKGPTFVKEFTEDNQQLNDLHELLKIAPKEITDKINEDIKMLSYGISGEKNIAYELENSYMPILILHDLHLEYNGLTAQIDYVVIDTKFILVIECKKMVGDIEITNQGDFIRHFKSSTGKVYKKEGMYSPVVQNERHVEMIKRILIDGMDTMSKKHFELIKAVVVVANPKTLINNKFAKKDVKDKIIKHEQLINYMKDLHAKDTDSYWFTESGMFKVADVLMKYNTPYVIDYNKKYGVDFSVIYSKPDEQKVDEDTTSILAAPKAAKIENNESIVSSPLYIELKKYRLDKSRSEGIKPYFIYNNAQLEEIIKVMPKTIDELKKVNGFADVKCQKYGGDILEIVCGFLGK